ncbi:MAG TPA: flavin reductase family protein [Candidatus Binataceae bacterium]|nr:flavin reductase family protein [Candidatus Binataceae bacterium]
MDENAKKKGLRMIPYGLQVLGARNGDKQTVATINWTTQASFQPPLVVVGIKTDSTAHELVKQSKKFTLSMLGAGQKDLALAFFKHVDPKDGKFGNYAYESGKNGAPIVSDAAAAVECDVVHFYEHGDHSIAVGVVTEAYLKKDVDPLTLKECGFNYGG